MDYFHTFNHDPSSLERDGVRTPKPPEKPQA